MGDSTTTGGSLSSGYDAYGACTVLDTDGSEDGDTDEIHADAGSYYVIDSTKLAHITPRTPHATARRAEQALELARREGVFKAKDVGERGSHREQSPAARRGSG